MRSKLLLLYHLLSGTYIPFIQANYDSLGYLPQNDGQKEVLKKSLQSYFGHEYEIFLLDLGRSAIQVSLLCADIRPGREVIIPTFACTGVIMPVIQAGLIPVLADVDDDFNLSFSAVREVYSPDAAAIILPHLSGAWAKDAEQIIEWAKSKNIFVIEDICQAFGLQKTSEMAGTFGNVGVFSIGAGKPLLGPGGGGIITSNAKISSRLKALDLPELPVDVVEKRKKSFITKYSSDLPLRTRGRAFTAEYVSSILSLLRKYKSNVQDADPFKPWRFTPFSMPEELAFFGNITFNSFSDNLQSIQRNASLIYESLSHLENKIHLPRRTDNTLAKFLVWSKDSKVLQRLRSRLFAHGIVVEPSYVPLHLRGPFTIFKRSSMKNVEQQWQGAFSIPVWPNIDIDRILRAVRAKI